MKKILFQIIINLILVIGLISCRTPQSMYEDASFIQVGYVDKYEPSFLRCSSAECSLKYSQIDALISQQDYQAALNDAIQLFKLDVSGVYRFSIKPHLNNELIANSNLLLEIELSHKAFVSASYLVMVLVHELGHIRQYHKIHNKFKEYAGISEELSNLKFVAFIEGLATFEQRIFLEKYYRTPFFGSPYMEIDRHEISEEQYHLLSNYLEAYQSLHARIMQYYLEIEAGLFVLQHRENLYLSLDSPQIVEQIKEIKDNILFARKFFEKEGLVMVLALVYEGKVKEGNFINSLMEEMQKRCDFVESYLKELEEKSTETDSK